MIKIFAATFLLYFFSGCLIPYPEIAEREYLPILMVHGFLGSGDTFAKHKQLFIANDYPQDHVRVFDWNSLGDQGLALSSLDNFIDKILSETGKEQLNLCGHSAGGSLSYDYLSQADRAAKVANYVHIGSAPKNAPAGPLGEIPTLSLYSLDDMVIDLPGIVTGAKNVELPEQDHYQVATSEESFKEIFSFLNEGFDPQINIPDEEQPNVSGKVLTFGDNFPKANATVSVYKLENGTGFRNDPEPKQVFTTDASGAWGPFEADPNSHYEFLVEVTGERPLHYYREAFESSDHLVYLRTIPPPITLAGILLAGIPSNDDQSVMAVFSSSRAVIHGRDELHIDTEELSTPVLASADQTTIAFFIYDADEDGASSFGVIDQFADFPFISGIDIYYPTTDPVSIEIQLDERELFVPNWRSATEGISVIVFD